MIQLILPKSYTNKDCWVINGIIKLLREIFDHILRRILYSFSFLFNLLQLSLRSFLYVMTTNKVRLKRYNEKLYFGKKNHFIQSIRLFIKNCQLSFLKLLMNIMIRLLIISCKIVCCLPFGWSTKTCKPHYIPFIACPT